MYASLLLALLTPHLAGDVDVTLPNKLHELDSPVRFRVDARDVSDSTLNFTVRQNGVDITASVAVTVVTETRTDTDSDGILEDLDGLYRLDFLSQARDADDLITVAATIGGVTGRSGRVVRPNLELGSNGRIYTTETSIDVLSELSDIDLLSETLTVEFNGVDVTTSVTIPSHTVLYTDTSGSRLRYAWHERSIDISALTLTTGSTLSVSSTASATRGAVGSRIDIEVGGPPPIDGCFENLLDSLCEDLDLSNDSGGKVTTSKTGPELDTILDNFRISAELLCPSIPNGPVEHTCPDGTTMQIEMETNGGDVDISERADVVIGLGGNASQNSSSQGGDADVTNKQNGGLALASGGDGSLSNNPGDGGDAEATGTCQVNASGGAGGRNSDCTEAGGAGGTAATLQTNDDEQTETGEDGMEGAEGENGANDTPGSAGGGSYAQQGSPNSPGNTQDKFPQIDNPCN